MTGYTEDRICRMFASVDRLGFLQLSICAKHLSSLLIIASYQLHHHVIFVTIDRLRKQS